jgi:hypothetical protein
MRSKIGGNSRRQCFSNIEMAPLRVAFAIKGGGLLIIKQVIAGNARTKTLAISEPWRFSLSAQKHILQRSSRLFTQFLDIKCVHPL